MDKSLSFSLTSQVRIPAAWVGSESKLFHITTLSCGNSRTKTTSRT